MTLQWFYSRTARHASEMARQMKRLINEQRDLLSPEALKALETARLEAVQTIRSQPSKEVLKSEMKKMEETARKWFKAHPFPAVRENVKELLVAVVVILGFTSFFLQLTKIPTGSMQPTLFGITHRDLRGTNFEMPGFLGRLKEYWVKGVTYKQLVAPHDGVVREIAKPQTIFPFIKKQRILFGDKWLTIWLAPERFNEMIERTGVLGHAFKQGEDIIKMKVTLGDHLLVDRFTYNFRHPKRGEIIVFKTRGIQGLDQDVLYIKRLVGMPKERIQVGDDRHLVINGDRLDASDSRFENVYTFQDPAQHDYPYLGHVNQKIAREVFSSAQWLAPLFPHGEAYFQIGPKHYMAMGDNTLNSLDSRAWGDFPQNNVIGKCWFVYWPITHRFGWGNR